MKMKKVTSLFLAAAMVAGLTACGGGSGKEASSGSGEKKEADSGKKTITFCFRDVGRILRTFKIKKNVEVTDNGKIII